MATRATIAVKTPEGIRSIYCHYDGYPERTGKVLAENYTAAEKLEALIALGDLSYIAEEVGTEKQDFSDPTMGVSLAYGRDRGETGVEPRVHANIQEWLDYRKEQWCDYGYLWTEGTWDTFDLAD
jgi:hypothetical protein